MTVPPLQNEVESFKHFADILEPLGLFLYRWAHSSSGSEQIFFSPKLLSLTGFPPEHFSEPSVWLTLIAPEDRAKGVENARKLQEGIPCICEYRIITKDGASCWIRDAARPIEENGRVVWIEGVIQDITDLRLAEQAMQQSEERERARAEELDAILESAPVAILIARDPSCQRMTGNRRAYEQLNLVKGSNVSVSAPLDERPSGFRLMKDKLELSLNQLPVQIAAQTGKEVRSFEYDIVFPDDSYRTVLGNASPLRDAQGNPRGAVGSFVDITEEKRAEEAIRASETRYRALFEAANDAIFLMDEEHFLDCNKRALQMYGCEYSEIVGHSPAEFSPERQPDGKLSRDGSAVRIMAALEGNPQVFEWQHRRLDGTLFDAEVSLNLIQTGEKQLLQAIVRDITERKRAEAELRESEQRFRIAAASASDIIYQWDIPTGQMTWYGDIDTLLGYPPNGFPRTLAAWESSLHPEDFDRVLQSVELHLQDNSPYQEEYRMRDHDGNWRIWTDRGTVLRDENGHPLRWIGVNSDITARRELERIMEKTRADFLFAVSHELKTPLLVMGAAQETLAALPSEVRVERFVALEEVWQRNLLRLRQIIENLVDSQRPEHMGMRLARVPADLVGIVRHTIEELAPYASSLRVKIDLNVKPLPLLALDSEVFQAWRHGQGKLGARGRERFAAGGRCGCGIRSEGSTFDL
jgi:PAS domain S-box-containing protein